MTLSTAAAALQLLNNTLSALRSIRERAQTSKDTYLKDEISTFYDSLLSLKEAVILVTDENRELKEKIEKLERPAEMLLPELRQVGAVNYYFVGEEGPFCQACYDGKGKLTRLSPPEDWNRGVRRQCVLCGEYFYEKKMDVSQRAIRRRPYGY